MHLLMIGGSDAGISAALHARKLEPSADVTVVVADSYPNFSICGIPYYVSGEVTHWRNLAHRTVGDLEATGMALRLDTTARRIDVPAAARQALRGLGTRRPGRQDARGNPPNPRRDQGPGRQPPREAGRRVSAGSQWRSRGTRDVITVPGWLAGQGGRRAWPGPGRTGG
jgi:NADPH-dependent 2,4-dienoyl-CoA reductase/sulfur reductase-like enzyme